MIEIKNKKFKKLISFLKKLPMILAKKAFFVSLISFFIALILGGLVFLKYWITIQKEESLTYKKEIEFNEKGFQDILNFWQEREKRFQEADFKNYLNPFLID